MGRRAGAGGGRYSERMVGTNAAVREVIEFWFGDAPAADPDSLRAKIHRWYQGNPEMDAEVSARFGGLVKEAVAGGLREWEGELEKRLALVLLLDQFTRNVFRDSPAMYAGDARAQQLAWETSERGELNLLPPEQRQFMIMPLMHSENLTHQDRSVVETDRLVGAYPGPLRSVAEGSKEYARNYRAIIARFGRFPHRNEILGRVSTPEEIEFLKSSKQG